MNEPDLTCRTDAVLQAKAVGKLYARRRSDMRSRLSQSAWRAFLNLPAPKMHKLKSSEFWAVKDISFDLHRGEAIGIIGLNGSGKTTLLRMLAGQILPDAGEISIKGTTASMIDLSAGFQRSASGRENIFLRAAALGFSRTETNEKLKEIIDFSEVEHALDAPLATYSSGMQMRLAFSIMAIVSPSVLLIDEVLAVGDFQFRQKCLGKIREMRSRSAFVFVSHSMGDIGRFCDRVIVLNKGEVVFYGEPDDAINYYLNDMQQDSSVKVLSESKRTETYKTVEKAFSLHSAPISKSLDVFEPKPYENPDIVGEIRFSVDGADVERVYKRCFDRLEFSVTAQIRAPCRRLIFGFTVLTEAGEGIYGVASDSQQSYLTLDGPSRVFASIAIDELTLMPGKYVIYFNMREGVELIYRSQLFEVVVDTPPHNTFGVTLLSHEWTVGEIPSQ